MTDEQQPISRRARREAERLQGLDSGATEHEIDAAALVPLAGASAARPLVDAASVIPDVARAPRPVVNRVTPGPVVVRTPPAPTAQRRRSRSLRTVASVGSLTVVAGLVAVLSLPAYAFDPAADSQAAIAAASALRAKDVQKLSVSAQATQEAVVRDSFSAPTSEQLAAARAQAAALAAAAAAEAQRLADAEKAAKDAASGVAPTTTGGAGGTFSTVTPREIGDDYPWRDAATESEGGGLSPLRYYYRECVDFVAWRLNRDAGSTGSPWKWTWANMTPGGGSAYAWAGQWANNGWKTSNVPVVGSVAWFDGNHVAYVQAVNADSTVTIEEYNQNSDHMYHKRTIPVSDAALYLYPPG